MITFEQAHYYLRYNPKTGRLYWKFTEKGWKQRGRAAGSIDGSGYYLIGILGRYYKAARVIWLMQTGKWPKHHIDHKNLIRHDDRWRNLREATPRQNAANRRAQKNNTSGYKGVSWDLQNKKWRATIRLDGRSKTLGLFSTILAAHVAYLKAAKQHHGEYARAR